jgi:hypothetical protein
MGHDQLWQGGLGGFSWFAGVAWVMKIKLERKFVLFLKNLNFHRVLRNTENLVLPSDPMPGQKIISRVSRDQKRRRFPFSKCGLPPFQPGYPFATASLCGNAERRP